MIVGNLLAAIDPDRIDEKARELSKTYSNSFQNRVRTPAIRLGNSWPLMPPVSSTVS